MERLKLPPNLRGILSPALSLSDEELDAWLSRPVGKCPLCGEMMQKWEELNGACVTCYPPTVIRDCSCVGLDRPQQWGHGGWHMIGDGAHGTAWERCPQYERAKRLADPLVDS